MATTKRDQGSDIQIMELNQSVITVPILGTTPFVCRASGLAWTGQNRRSRTGEPDRDAVKDGTGASGVPVQD